MMNNCNNCKIHVNNSLKYCPLCLKHIDGIIDVSNSEYPVYKKYDKTILSFGLKVLLFIFITISSITIFINLITWNGYPWFLFVISSLAYVWILIKSTIIGRSHFGTKVLIQLFGLSIFLIIVDSVENGIYWSVNYVIPGLIIISNFLITLTITKKRIKWKDYSVFLIILILLGFIPSIFFGFNIINILWPSITAGIYTVLTFFGFFIFSFKKFSQELFKVFHF